MHNVISIEYNQRQTGKKKLTLIYIPFFFQLLKRFHTSEECFIVHFFIPESNAHSSADVTQKRRKNGRIVHNFFTLYSRVFTVLQQYLQVKECVYVCLIRYKKCQKNERIVNKYFKFNLHEFMKVQFMLRLFHLL